MDRERDELNKRGIDSKLDKKDNGSNLLAFQPFNTHEGGGRERHRER